MSTNKLKKFTSFRHRRENVDEEGRRTNPRGVRVRRNSFSGAEEKEEVVEPPKYDFLGIRKAIEDKTRRKNMEKRKSVSTDNITLGRTPPPKMVLKKKSFLRSEGDLGNMLDPVMVELKRTLASRAIPQVVVQPPETEADEEVPLRRQSSHQLRQDPTKSKTCFLYPGPRTQRLSEAVIVRQGPIEKVKVSTGRRLPRNWSRRKHAVLVSDGRLLLSEDVNLAVESVKRMDLGVDTVDVGGARVSRGSTHTTKKNVIELIGVDGRLTLLQNDDGPTTDGWFEALFRTAGPPRGGSLPRAKSMRAPASHDITALTAHDSTVRSALGRFFSGGRRPTREALEKSGIYRDEPVFGSRLESLCAGPAGAPPQFVRECTRALGEPPHVLQVGLYRTSGNLSHIQRLRLRVDQNDQKAIAEEQDSDVLAGALKLFFRELREPLIPYTAYVKLLDEIGAGTEKVRRLVIKLLPPAHVTTLAALCRHLAHVCSYEQKNQMNPQSMAIVWGPSLTWPDDATQDAMLACTRINRLIEYLIQNERAIF